MEPLLFRNGNSNPLRREIQENVSVEPLLFRNGNYAIIRISTLKGSGGVSVEPLLFRNGNVSNTGSNLPNISSFSGATSFQKWKLNATNTTAQPEKNVSVEPLLFRNGNGAIRDKFIRIREEFQWSHFFSEMEITPGAFPESNINKFQWSHFFSEMEIISNDRGYGLHPNPKEFQWSHFFSEMEMRVCQ